MRIKQLSPLLASQIAAGEVVERPASVLKELVENSLDAGSSKIDIMIEAGGVKLIQVRDNGKGIHQEDLTLAFAQHATSKIAELTDLACINSLGFRGEALASIAAVSEVVISSKPSDQVLAGKMSNQDWIATPAAHPDGTTIKVSNLFYNIPARRKFLRSERTEYVHLEEVFKRIVLSHFEVGFSWNNNGKEVYSLPACILDHNQHKQEARLAKIFGERMLANAVYIDISQNGLRLWGWLGLPVDARATSELQFFYINKRIVRDRLINHALKTGYQEYLTADRHATYCLYLEIDPASIDVNVHPTKHEIRFRDSRVVYAFLVSALQQSLAQIPAFIPELSPEPAIATSAYMRNTAYADNAQHSNFEQPKSYNRELVTDLVENNSAVTIEAILGNGRFILAEYFGLVLIDVVRAKVMLYIEEIKAVLTAAASEVASMNLTPSPVLLLPSSAAVIANVINSLELFATMGFTLTQIGKNEIVVNAVPQQLGHGEFMTVDFFIELTELFAKNGFKITCLNSNLDWLLKILLKHFKFGQPSIAGHELVAFVSRVAPFFRKFSLTELVEFAG